LDGTSDKADEFLALLRPLQGRLEVYARRMLRDGSLVEDVLQSAVMEAFVRFDRFAEGSNFRAWMFRFVTWEVFNRNRKCEPDALGEAPADWPDASSDSRDWRAMVRDDPEVVMEHLDDALVDALGRLAPRERAALLLRAIGEFSYHEIHEILAIPTGSVVGYLSRARQKLRSSLADYAAERGLSPRRLSHGEPRS
jgi:RNA polymerase sigma-70 factor (ECF subfamily)